MICINLKQGKDENKLMFLRPNNPFSSVFYSPTKAVFCLKSRRKRKFVLVFEM